MEEIRQNELNFIECNFNEFLSSLQLLMPDMFEIESPTVQLRQYEDSGVTRIYLTKSCMAEDLTDLLVSKMNLNILFAQKSVNGKTYDIAGISNLNPSRMYIVEIPSDLYGIVNYINVTFYDSLEIMYEATMSRYEDFMKHEKNHIVMEKMSISQIWNLFKA